MKALYYAVDKEPVEVKPANGKDFKLKELQKFVDGYIEIVPLGKKIIVVNEEGKCIGLPYNVLATIEWNKVYGQTDVIVGDALICDSEMVE